MPWEQQAITASDSVSGRRAGCELGYLMSWNCWVESGDSGQHELKIIIRYTYNKVFHNKKRSCTCFSKRTLSPMDRVSSMDRVAHAFQYVPYRQWIK